MKITHRTAHKRAMVTTEDALVYNVFNRLTYLGSDFIRNFLFQFLSSDDIYFRSDNLNSFNFWPKWDTKSIDEVANTTYIEPDIFIRFEYTDIIIEAKRYDLKQQDETQWDKQIKVYKHHFGIESKKLIYIALGGMSFSQKKEKRAIITQIYWFQIAQLLKKYLLQNLNTEVDNRILIDTLDILKYYNHIPLGFMEELQIPNIKYKLNAFNN